MSLVRKLLLIVGLGVVVGVGACLGPETDDSGGDGTAAVGKRQAGPKKRPKRIVVPRNRFLAGRDIPEGVFVAFAPSPGGMARDFDFSPDGKLAAVASNAGVEIRKVPSLELVKVLRGRDGFDLECDGRHVSWFPNSKWLALNWRYFGKDGKTVNDWRVAVVDVETEKLIGYYMYGPSEMFGITVAPDGKHVAVVGFMGETPRAYLPRDNFPDVRIWNVETNTVEMLAYSSLEEGGSEQGIFSSSGKYFAVISGSAEPRIWNLSKMIKKGVPAKIPARNVVTGVTAKIPKVHRVQASIAFGKDGHLWVSCQSSRGERNWIYRIDPKTGYVVDFMEYSQVGAFESLVIDCRRQLVIQPTFGGAQILRYGKREEEWYAFSVFGKYSKATYPVKMTRDGKYIGFAGGGGSTILRLDWLK